MARPRTGMRLPAAVCGLTLVWLVTAGGAPAAESFDLDLEIVNVKESRGLLWVALYRYEGQESWPDEPDRGQTLEAVAGEVSARFDALLSGDYAIRVYQDLDGDGTLAMTKKGRPKEPVGASNNPRLARREPDIGKCVFRVGAESGSLTIRLVHPPKSRRRKP